MKTKSKVVGFVGGLGALCVLCCSLPILGIMGLGALETFFCENEMLKGMGVTLLVGSVIYFAIKAYQRTKTSASSCAINCDCKAN